MLFLFEHTPLRFLVEGIWRDEAFSFLLAQQPIGKLVQLTASDFNPPLYYLLLKMWMLFFGTSEIALRSLSFLMYVVGVFFVFEVFKVTLKMSYRNAAFYTLLFAGNPLLLYYAFEARMYTMLFCFGIMSSFFLFQKNYPGYVVATVIGLYSHYFMAFIFAGQAIYSLLMHKGKFNEPIFRMMLYIGLAFLPWFIYFITQNTAIDNQFWVSKLKEADLFIIPGFLFSGIDKDYYVSFPYIPRITFLLHSFSLFVFFVIGLAISQFTSKNITKLILYFLIQACIPILVVLLLNDFKPLFVPRYLIFASASISLVLIILTSSVPLLLRTAIIAFILFFTIQFNSLQLNYRERGHIKAIVPQVSSILGPSDSVFVTSELDLMEAQYYFGVNRVFIYGKKYSEIPSYVGKVLIPESRIAHSYPLFPAKAIILSEGKNKKIQVESRFKPL